MRRMRVHQQQQPPRSDCGRESVCNGLFGAMEDSRVQHLGGHLWPHGYRERLRFQSKVNRWSRPLLPPSSRVMANAGREDLQSQK
mmetsp:Transcript_14738/g.41500  ORF Transcript_14738/g.41500 Transcript_14738/m.41500 type:complete len:85 (+) Transcript_14738:416-670(+)